MLEDARPKQRMVTIGEKSACLLALNPFLTEVLPTAPVTCHRHPRVEMAFVGDAVAKDVLEGIDQGVTEGGVLTTRASRVTNPGGDELPGGAMFGKAGKFAKLVELAASDDVERVGDGESVADVLVSDVELFDMEHVDSKDATGSLVVEAGDAFAVLFCERPRLASIEGCVDRDGQED
jgi:hypothetical protein